MRRTQLNKSIHAALFPLVLGSLACGNVLAQGNSAAAGENVQALGTLSVVGSRLAENRSELASTVQIIDHDALEGQISAGLSLKEALGNLVPGIDLGGQSRSNFGQNVRGRPMLVMIDGVSLNSARDTARQLDSVDPFNIERIEVLSGANALYGGGATGGIVNIVTRKAADGGVQFSSQVGLTSGFETSDDLQWRLAQSVAGGNDRVKARLAIAVQQNGSFYDARGTQVRTDIAQTDAQNTQTIDVMGNVQINLAPHQTLGLTAQYYRNRFNGSSYLYGGPNYAGMIGKRPELLEQRNGFVSDVMPQTERAFLNADYYVGQVLGGQDLYVQAFWRKENMDFAPFVGAVVTSSHQNTTVGGLKAALAKEIDAVTVRYGLDWDRETFDSKATAFDRAQAYASGGMTNIRIGETGRYPDYAITNTAAFGQAEWRATPTMTVKGGLRYQHSSVDVSDFVGYTQQLNMLMGNGRSADAIAGGKKSYNVMLANAGVHFKPIAGHEGWLSYSEGFEIPDPGKYYGMGIYQRNGNHWNLVSSVNPATSPLEGIKTKQVELGWKTASGGWTAQSALFYSWSDKTMVLGTSSTNVTVSVADSKRRNYGFEGALAYAFNQSWQVGGQWLLIRSENKNAGKWVRQSIMTASPSKLGAFAQWSNQDWTSRLQATRMQSLSDDSGNRINGYTLVDVLGSKKLAGGTLSFGVQNLLNRQYLTTWSQRAMALYGAMASKETFAFNGRGRTFSVAYSIDY